ncbi:EG45-like domain containing protein 2 [Glycine soja]|uniref:EG45-like domain containing protein 2 n=1 Tax=Glycine soja TaxID=3848 RepID=A0A445GVD2_GLYSO|nr:EG45-like domain containing protein 2 [Glycine soja]
MVSFALLHLGVMGSVLTVLTTTLRRSKVTMAPHMEAKIMALSHLEVGNHGGNASRRFFYLTEIVLASIVGVFEAHVFCYCFLFFIVLAATACDGNRPGQFPPGNLFVTVNEGLWDNGAVCGRRYKISCVSGNNRPCKGGSINVKVVDSCSRSPCPNTLLMSKDAFVAISHFPHAKINIEYTR